MSTVANQAEAVDAEPPAPRTTIAGRYEVDLEAPLGGGGMAVVYLGRDLRTRRQVAVKTLRLAYRRDVETRARFRREARLMAFLAHPNVVRVYDFVEDHGASWVILEYVAGRSLKEMIAERGAIPPAEVAPILDQTAAALAHLHARGLVHLDVKPQNLLVTPEGRLKLIDFGLAQRTGATQETINGTTFGTAAYLAPEQACGEPVEAATDVYALGCVVYELLTGRPPFLPGKPGEVKNDVIRAHLERDAEPPSRVRADLDLSRWIDDVLLWALAKEPAARYGSVESFARVFRAGVAGEEVGTAGTTAPMALVDLPARRPAPLVPDRPRTRSAADDVSVDAPFDGAASKGSPIIRARGRWSRRTRRLGRLLWRGAIGLAVGNAVLAGSLFLTQGEVPGVYTTAAALGPGATARVVVDDLRVRNAPGLATTQIAGVDRGERLRVTAAAAAVDATVWWPVRFARGGATVEGFVAAEGIVAEESATPLERLRDAIGLA